MPSMGTGTKVAIITGGGRGIGRTIALYLGELGISVVVAARTNTEIESVSSEIRLKGAQALAIKTDVMNIQEVNHCVNATLKKFGRIDILVNCAGIFYISALMQSDETKWRQDFETKVFGTYYFCRGVLKTMMNQRSGRIINVSSRMAKTPIALFSSYSASNAAIIGLTKSLALEVANYNITVNAICPGLVETGMLNEGIKAVSAIQGIDFAVIKEKLKKSIPIGRFITSEECAKLIAFLVSDEAECITGESINISGGLEMH